MEHTSIMVEIGVYIIKVAITLIIVYIAGPEFVWKIVHAMTSAYFNNESVIKSSHFKRKSNEQKEEE